MNYQDEKALIEARLLEELSEIDRKIKEMEREREALQRVITRVRQEKLAAQDVTRKNSFSRILVEKQILEILEKEGKFIKSYDLLKVARGVNFSLKDVTFRSYLHRLKEKGVIEPSRTRGAWRLVKNTAG